MKKLATIALCTAALLAGCESVSSRMQDRFSPVPPRSRTFASNRKAAFAAAQQAVKNVGLLLGHTSLARGEIDGYAPITAGDATRDTHQTTIEVRLVERDAGETQVDLLVWEQTEGNFPGGVDRHALRDHSLYELYFNALQQLLPAASTPPAGVNP